MTERERLVAAGEYVLGTLPTAERGAFGARLLTDRLAAEAVRFWERAFAPLGFGASAETPSPAVWTSILARIGGRPVANDRVSAWRAAALGLGALAASLGAFVLLRLPPGPVVITRSVVVDGTVAAGRPIVQAAAPGYLAALSPKGDETALLLTLDAKTGAVEAHPVKLSAPNKRVLELWWIADGSKPRAVGLLDPARPLRVKLDQPGQLDGGTFAVSVEHEGGSVTGNPGKVVYSGKLVQVAS